MTMIFTLSNNSRGLVGLYTIGGLRSGRSLIVSLLYGQINNDSIDSNDLLVRSRLMRCFDILYLCTHADCLSVKSNEIIFTFIHPCAIKRVRSAVRARELSLSLSFFVSSEYR